MRIRPGDTRFEFLSRPNSAAVAKSLRGFDMVDANTRLRAIDTIVPISSNCKTRSRSSLINAFISPVALRKATTPIIAPSFLIGAMAKNSFCPTDGENSSILDWPDKTASIDAVITSIALAPAFELFVTSANSITVLQATSSVFVIGVNGGE